MGASGSKFQVWSQEEHDRFMAALQLIGNYSPKKELNDWDVVTRQVSTRVSEDVYRHASNVLKRMMASDVQVGKTKAQICALYDFLDDGDWAYEEDLAFEKAVAFVDMRKADRWEIIAASIPGKSSVQVRKRYQKYLFDHAMVENGHTVRVKYPKRIGGLQFESENI